ncbi:hypothetical protein, partial [Klebsiella pneumoniae]|uniref:hypothetical protein n=1 Tax=Klebsiella pneumoniae TaxID=573 RepID=UPI001D0F1B9F
MKQVEDMVAASVYNNDVDNQLDTMNYIYDKSGNLVEDKSEQLKLRWTYYGKLKEVDSAGVPKLRFYYDAMGN